MDNGSQEEWPDDATDWPIKYLRDIDNSLRCPICQEYFHTAMLLSKCSHNYCSVCIRRYLATDSRCPTCRQIASESDMINNRLLDSLVIQFSSNRKELLDMLAMKTSGKEYGKVFPSNFLLDTPIKVAPHDSGSISSRILEKREMDLISPASELQTKDTLKTVITNSLGNTDTSSAFCSNSMLNNLTSKRVNSEIKTNMIRCPTCNASIQDSLINVHLDQCLLNGASGSDISPGSNTACSSNSELLSKFSTSAVQINDRSDSPKMRKRLPKICYNLMKDQKLKTVLVDLGLPSHGDRQRLIWRHSEYLILHNSNCDASAPLSQVELKKKLEDLEKLHKKDQSNHHTARVPMSSEANRAQASFDEESRAYVKKHRTQFEALTNDAKERRRTLRKT